jgi:arsenite methyltransferase
VWHSHNPERTKRVLAAWDEHATDPYLPRTLAIRLRRAGFFVESPQVMPLLNADFDANTYSNRVIDLIVSFVVGQGKIPRHEANTWACEMRQLGEGGEYFFSVNRYLFWPGGLSEPRLACAQRARCCC